MPLCPLRCTAWVLVLTTHYAHSPPHIFLTTMAAHTFDSSLFSHTMNTSTITSTPLPPPSQQQPQSPLDTMMPTTIKMEMIENCDHSPSPSQRSASQSSEPSQTPAPESSASKPVKKRKSWGQVLPEPKTSLPPRKRAKTEDEKEQRRIERVKRNRLAAHNSRERKRQEYEVLQNEKDELEASMRAYKEKMAQMEAELRYYRTKYPGEAPTSTPFDLSTPPHDSFNTICPAQIPTSFPSPESMDSMDSPRDSSCQPETPPSSFEASPEFDSTQYSAAVLCDLQCQSSSGASLRTIWTYLSLFNLSHQSMTSPLSWKTSSTSTSSPSAAQPRLHQWNPLLAWWILLRSMSLGQPSSTTTLTQTLTAFLTALMQSSMTCRVPLAQLRLATRPSQRDHFSSDATMRSNKSESEQAGSVDGCHRSRLMRSPRSIQMGRRNGVQTGSIDRALLARENLGRGFTWHRTESVACVA
jgi:transcriptional activator HAC1